MFVWPFLFENMYAYSAVQTLPNSAENMYVLLTAMCVCTYVHHYALSTVTYFKAASWSSYKPVG